MPINVFQIYISIPCNKSIVCFIHKLYYILKKNVVLCITLPCRRGSRPDGTRTCMSIKSHHMATVVLLSVITVSTNM